jgi:hypothetical protein
VNALQSEAPTGTGNANYITFNYFSPNYGLPNTWVQPRMLYLVTRVTFSTLPTRHLCLAGPPEVAQPFRAANCGHGQA